MGEPPQASLICLFPKSQVVVKITDRHSTNPKPTNVSTKTKCNQTTEPDEAGAAAWPGHANPHTVGQVTAWTGSKASPGRTGAAQLTLST